MRKQEVSKTIYFVEKLKVHTEPSTNHQKSQTQQNTSTQKTQTKYTQKMITYTWSKYIGSQKWFCAVFEYDLSIKMCLQIQENCFRTIKGSLDSFERQISTHKGQVSAFLRYIEISRIWWKNRHFAYWGSDSTFQSRRRNLLLRKLPF